MEICMENVWLIRQLESKTKLRPVINLHPNHLHFSHFTCNIYRQFQGGGGGGGGGRTK